jgi:two-component system LytT family response regulator
MKALIIDDERLARVELKRLLTPFKDINVVGEAVNADDAISKITELNPDLIFLDIGEERVRDARGARQCSYRGLYYSL